MIVHFTDEQMVCVGCGKHPSQIEEYVAYAKNEPNYYKDAADFCSKEEGTLNPENGHFACTMCYIKMGQPSSTYGWVAP